MPVLSIIVPAYNVEKYLESCIFSILNGSFQNLEILLIDDGSTDRTGIICDQLSVHYSAVRVFHTVNRGLAEARNLGLAHATGDLVGFVDSDDMVASDMFEHMVRAMTDDVQLVLCHFRRCMEGDAQTTPLGATPTRVVSQEECVDCLLNDNYGTYVWNKLFRMSILREHQIRFPKDCRAIEDIFFVWTYMLYCSKVSVLSQSFYQYIMHSGSIMNTFRNNRIISDSYMNLSRGWRYCAEIVQKIAPQYALKPIARTAMFYQTVLRKLEYPSSDYIKEAQEYVQRHGVSLLRYLWGWKYYVSALILSISYPLWKIIFRHGIK